MAEYPKPMTKQSTKKLYDQMENYLYKLNESEEKYEIGFFCYINYQNTKIPVLIANNNILKEKNNNINISLNNTPTNIKLGQTRYINTKYNLTLVEIKENEDYKINFFEIDDIIYLKNPDMYYYNESIYILQYDNEKNDILVSYGLIKNINNSEIVFRSSIIPNPKNFPILNSLNNKLIGLNKSGSNNKGIFFDLLINMKK